MLVLIKIINLNIKKMKKKLFLTFSACVFSFTIIFTCTAPIVNWDIIGASFWRDDICGEKDYLCRSKKAMYYLEYLVVSIDIVFGFICSVLGFLYLFDFQIKVFNSCVIGILGFISACIIFVITTVYLCFSGYIFVNAEAKNYDNGFSSDKLLKTDEDGIFALLVYDDSSETYKYIFYNEIDDDKITVRFRDLGKKQYNYQKEIKFANDYNKEISINAYNEFCKAKHGTYSSNIYYQKLYAPFEGFENKYVYDRWLTTIVISCLIILSSIGMAIFGLLLTKE